MKELNEALWRHDGLIHAPMGEIYKALERSVLVLSILTLFFHFYVCSAWTHKLITAKDHASVQVNIGHLNEEGIYTGNFSTFALTGKVRIQGESDSAIDSLWKKKVAESSIAI